MTKPKNYTCEKCEALPAQYKLTNGSEVTRECDLCMKDTLLGMVTENYRVEVLNRGKDEDELIKLTLA